MSLLFDWFMEQPINLPSNPTLLRWMHEVFILSVKNGVEHSIKAEFTGENNGFISSR